MSLLKKLVLSGIVAAAPFMPLASFAQTVATTCSGAPPIMAPLEAKIRHEEAVRVGSEIINKVIYALNTIVMLENNPVEFERHLKFVLDLQENPQAPQFYIETIPPAGIFDEAAFRTVWTNNALRYKYRKRDVTNWIVESYSDINCQRTITLHGLGHTYGVFADTLPDGTAVPIGFHKSKTFLDFDRIQVVIVETSPNVFKSRKVIQYTESSFPLPHDAANGLLTSPPERDPLNPNAPAALPLDLTSR
ncbi:hypothetical protein [Noviherbaspirillum soli]|uniref:hypothetical protein n=1 Tax=Noviherbaspirillum soli TaxID=1064518 RepID=UPI00188CF502|nr:hypothetical protein [Noviherbaspirillum soli]